MHARTHAACVCATCAQTHLGPGLALPACGLPLRSAVGGALAGFSLGPLPLPVLGTLIPPHLPRLPRMFAVRGAEHLLLAGSLPLEQAPARSAPHRGGLLLLLELLGAPRQLLPGHEARVAAAPGTWLVHRVQGLLHRHGLGWRALCRLGPPKRVRAIVLLRAGGAVGSGHDDQGEQRHRRCQRPAHRGRQRRSCVSGPQCANGGFCLGGPCLHTRIHTHPPTHPPTHSHLCTHTHTHTHSLSLSLTYTPLATPPCDTHLLMAEWRCALKARI